MVPLLGDHLSQTTGGGHASSGRSVPHDPLYVRYSQPLVRDVAKSTAFYRDVLGFTMGETVPDKEPFVFVWLKRDDVSVFLNDIKAAAHDYPAAASAAAGRHRGDVLHHHGRRCATTRWWRRRRT